MVRATRRCTESTRGTRGGGESGTGRGTRGLWVYGEGKHREEGVGCRMLHREHRREWTGGAQELKKKEGSGTVGISEGSWS